MNQEQSVIKRRQELYWLGQKCEEEGELLQAIEAYKAYSKYLVESDQHIPHQWVSGFYDQLGEPIKSNLHLEEFANGCTPQRAAEVYKELGERYLKIHSVDKAISNFEKAIAADPNIGVKKKLKELKRL